MPLNHTQKVIETLDYFPDCLAVKALDGKYLACNSNFSKLIKFTKQEEIKAKSDEAVFHDKQLTKQIQKDDQAALMSKLGALAIYQLPIERDDGKKLKIECKRSLINSNSGQTEALLIAFTDITDRQNLTVRKTDYIMNLFQNLPCHVYLKDKNGIFLHANDRQAQSVGFQKGEDIIGKTDYNIFPKKEADIYRENDLKAINLKKQIYVKEPSTLSSGKTHIFLGNKMPLYDENNNVIGVLGISTDITEEENSKKRVEMYLKNIISNLPGHVYWKDKEGRYLGCNTLQAKSLGFKSAKDMIGKTDYEMPWEKQAALYRKNDRQVMRTGIPVSTEESATLEGGGEHIFLAKKVPLIDDQNNVIGILGISFDITAEKEAEKLRHEKAVAEERYEAMKAIAATIAHELRTPLATMSTQAMGIKHHLPVLLAAYQAAVDHKLTSRVLHASQLKSLEKSIAKIESEIRASYHFIDMLLVNVKQSVVDEPLAQFSIATCIDEALKRYPFYGKQRDLINFNDNHDFTVNAKNLLLIHVFFNLLKNALHYIAAKPDQAGKIDIHLDDKLRQVYFKDTGTGIPKEELAHIFERFHSKTHHGTGIGLAFCKKVLEDLGGAITCQSVEHEFTEFVLTFPTLKE